MKLDILIGDEQRSVDVSDDMLLSAQPILTKMDADMDTGWQLGKQFIENPNLRQRCQIAANRLLTALHTENEASVMLMSAYILTRLNNVQTVDMNTEGEMEDTLFYDQANKLIE